MLVRVEEIRFSVFHFVPGGDRTHRGRESINSESRSKDQSKQPGESRLIRSVFPIGELSIKKQPKKAHRSRPNDVFLEQLPLPELYLRRSRRKGCRVDQYLSNDPGGRSAYLAATCGCWKDAQWLA